MSEGDFVHRTGDASVAVESPDPDTNDPDNIKFKFSLKKLWRFAGPGWLMSLAYLDPGNLESDLQQGAYTGYRITWVLWWATVMGLILQEMSARLGVVTGKDLAQHVREGYPFWLNVVVYIMMEIAVIAADIQEVVGSAVALQLLFGLPVWAGCLITGIDTFTFLAVHYLGVRYLEALVTIMIGTMSICFFVNWATVGSDPAELMYGWVVPTMQPWAVAQAVGTIGAVIMPHNLYLHSGLVLSRDVNRASPRALNEAITYNFIESAGALLFAFLINLAVVAVNAESFYDPACANSTTDPGAPYACLSIAAFNMSHDTTDLSDGDVSGRACVAPNADYGSGDFGEATVCGAIGLSSEGYALGAALGGDEGAVPPSGQCGSGSCIIWALGLLAAGQAATMTCTYAGQLIMGGCLHIRLKAYQQVAITRAVALVPAMAVALSATFSGDYNLFNEINEFLNILQSIQLPFAMLPVLHFASSADLLGRFRSSTTMLVITRLLALLVMAINVLLIVQYLQDLDPAWWVTLLVGVFGVFYFFICACLVWDDLKAGARLLLGRKPGEDIERLSGGSAIGALPPPRNPSQEKRLVTNQEVAGAL